MCSIKLLTTVPMVDINRDGVSVSVAGLTVALSRQNVDVEIVTSGIVYGLELPPEKVYRVNSLLLDHLRVHCAPFLKRILKKRVRSFQPEIMHVHGLWLPFNWTSSRIALDHNIPFIISPRGTLSAWALKHKGIKKRIIWNLIQEKLLCAAIAIHATSEQEALDIRNVGVASPIAIIPNAVELPSFLNSIQQQQKAANRSRTALFLSRIHPVKGLESLIIAWSRIRPKDWRLLIVGPDENGHKAEIERLINSLGLSNMCKIQAAANSTDKWSHYQQSDLFILPSLSENFGLVIAEALAVGKPVITTNKTPWKSIQDNKCGWWIDTGVASLEAAIREAISKSDEERYEMGRQGKLLIEKEYSWDKVAVQMIQLYEWVLGRGDKPKFIV